VARSSSSQYRSLTLTDIRKTSRLFRYRLGCCRLHLHRDAHRRQDLQNGFEIRGLWTACKCPVDARPSNASSLGYIIYLVETRFLKGRDTVRRHGSGVLGSTFRS